MAKKLNGRPKAIKKPFFRAAVQSDGTLELVIYEDIGQDWWDGGGVTSKTIKDQIDRAGNYSSILIRINSPGGDAFEGIAIYNVIRSQGKPVEVRVDGIAASAASIIAMAGDQIVMGPNTMMMIHNAWGFCMGTAVEMRKTAEALDKISGSIAQTYVVKTGKDLAEITALMDAETWMTAQECLEQHFATSIDGNEEVQESALALARRFKALARLSHVPDKLKAQAAGDDPQCACDCQNCQDGDCAECTNPNCEDPNCEDCPMQENAEASAAAASPSPAAVAVEPTAPPVESNLASYRARARLLTGV